MLNIETNTKAFAKITIANLANDRYLDLVTETIDLRDQGLTYDEIDEVLGLEIGTPNSCYALLKQQAAKAIARKIRANRQIEKILQEIC